MQIKFLSAALIGLMLSASSFAAAPADAPAGTTGKCKDGTYYSGAEKKGACRGHKGVEDRYTAAGKGEAGDTPDMAKAATTSDMTNKAAAATPAPMAAPKTTRAPMANAAPGGGPGMVWANESSKAYHCSTDRFYGKTKKGEYLSEADAKAKGYHADHGKACAG